MVVPVAALPGPNGRPRLPGTRLRLGLVAVMTVVSWLVGRIDAVACIGVVGVVVAGWREVRVVDAVANVRWRTVGVGQAGCRRDTAWGREGRRAARQRRRNDRRGSRCGTWGWASSHRQDRDLVHAITRPGTTELAGVSGTGNVTSNGSWRPRRSGVTALAGVTIHDTEVSVRTSVGGAVTEGRAALEGETDLVYEGGSVE